MKLVTFLVPAYNAEPYLDKCLASLVRAGESAEIIVVDDGSTDKTPQIADEWQAKYPTLIRAVHQENGGHGEGINVGIKLATGVYFKVVDADDWLDEQALMLYIGNIKKMIDENNVADVIFTRFIFDQISQNTQHEEGYDNVFKIRNEVHTWDKIKLWRTTQILMIHAISFRTEVLQKANFKLPKHRFYEDNVFVYLSIFHCKTVVYYPIPLYHYYVGREGQSVNLDIMAARYQQQIDNMEQIGLAYTWEQIKALPRKHKKTMIHLLILFAALTLADVSFKNTKETFKHYKTYIKSFKENNPALYRKLYHRTIFVLVTIQPKPLKILFARIGYKIVYKLTKWG